MPRFLDAPTEEWLHLLLGKKTQDSTLLLLVMTMIMMIMPPLISLLFLGDNEAQTGRQQLLLVIMVVVCLSQHVGCGTPYRLPGVAVLPYDKHLSSDEGNSNKRGEL